MTWDHLSRSYDEEGKKGEGKKEKKNYDGGFVFLPFVGE